MVDVVDSATRSRMMSGIRGKDTKPELLIRKGLHARGFRYRLHEARLAGKPDVVLSRYRAVVLIHGCFWHRHGCSMFRWPASNGKFWRKKLNRNAVTDQKNVDALLTDNWRVQIVWECALRGNNRLPANSVIDQVSRWIKSKKQFSEISGN